MSRLARNGGYQAIADICAKLNIPHTVENGGKHLKVRFTLSNKPFCIICAASPSDHRAYHSSRRATKNVLRSGGVNVDGL